MTDFTAFGLPETLISALTKIGFTTPTPIQEQAIPHALQGRDVLGTASTGTGKTAAFALPMMTHLINNPKSVALVMTPTRELATQVMSTIQPLRLHHKDVFTACLIGGESINKQLMQLERRPRLIVGTPGRINDHLTRGSLWLDRADFLVLDETDRMLDMGFGVQIEKIIVKMAKQRQTLMFSATLPKEIVQMAGQYLKSPQRITIGEVNKPHSRIKAVVVETTESEKADALQQQLSERTGSVIIFVKTRYGTEKLAKKLRAANHAADAIHGDLQQRKRDRVIGDFRDQKFRILVATDVAARGLDIPHIEHVINYDLPQAPEDYIHRIGRTARAGAEGEAVNLITPADYAKWRAIQKLINPEEDRNERSNRTADRNSPRRDMGKRKPQSGGRPSRFAGDAAKGGRSPWEAKKPPAAAARPDRASKQKRGFGGNPFEGNGREMEEAYRGVRREQDNYRNERSSAEGEGRSEARPEGRRREGGGFDDKGRANGGLRDDGRRQAPPRGEYRDAGKPARSGDFRDARRPVRGDDDRRPARSEDFSAARRPVRSDDDRRPARSSDFREERRPAYADDRRPARDDNRRTFGKKPQGEKNFAEKPFGGKSFGGKPSFGGGKKGGFSKPAGAGSKSGGQKRGRWAA